MGRARAGGLRKALQRNRRRAGGACARGGDRRPWVATTSGRGSAILGRTALAPDRARRGGNSAVVPAEHSGRRDPVARSFPWDLLQGVPRQGYKDARAGRVRDGSYGGPRRRGAQGGGPGVAEPHRGPRLDRREPRVPRRPGSILDHDPLPPHPPRPLPLRRRPTGRTSGPPGSSSRLGPGSRPSPRPAAAITMARRTCPSSIASGASPAAMTAPRPASRSRWTRGAPSPMARNCA